MLKEDSDIAPVASASAGAVSTAAAAAAPADASDAELPSESPEIYAMLSKLQDVATANGGNLEPDWGGSTPTPSDGQQQQRKQPASDTRKCCSSSSNGEPGGWDERRNGGTAPAGKERCVLEDFTQCSKSHLWKLMMSFYDRKGVESWSQVGLTRALPTCLYSVAVVARPLFAQEFIQRQLHIVCRGVSVCCPVPLSVFGLGI